MAGHSHWANIARKKSLIDAKRGKLWSKLAKAIIVAAKHGGADPDANLRLRYAIDAAKAVSMPKDNIQRAIRTGTGELKGGNLEESLYEGYAAGGVAVLCEILTDNKNRTAPEIRKIFEMCAGKLGGTGCVAYLFQRKGLVRVPLAACPEDRIMELALEAGADDVKAAGDRWEITCEPTVMVAVSDALRQAGLEVESNELVRIPTNTVDVEDVDTARRVLDLMERLDDHDDVQSVAANFNIPDAALAQLG
ncbi:MAG: YebC/PmpR family DNA-binding transcriptional regulator [Planctomycetota bacterium]|nr:MAG: YebC/PmpR family DNA-binding transcriptional regulator [Planctomycetota bacterium]